jgi:hypothetical protein
MKEEVDVQLLIHIFNIFPRIKHLEYSLKKKVDAEFEIEGLDIDLKILNVALTSLETFNLIPINYKSKIFL